MNEFYFRLAHLELLIQTQALKEAGVIISAETEMEQTNFSVDENGLNYDVVITTKVQPVNAPEYINVTISKYLNE